MSISNIASTAGYYCGVSSSTYRDHEVVINTEITNLNSISDETIYVISKRNDIKKINKDEIMIQDSKIKAFAKEKLLRSKEEGFFAFDKIQFTKSIQRQLDNIDTQKD